MAVKNSAATSARSFGLTFGILSAVLALHRWWRGQIEIAAAFAVVALLLCAITWLRPQLLDAPNRIWTGFAHALGWVNSRILLSLFFFVVITPYGVLQRLLGRDRLGRRWRATPPAWTSAPARLRNADHYEHRY